NLNYILEKEDAEVQEAYINAMTQLFDPHSTFLSADTLENFNSSVQNSFVGIGALLQDDDGICVIKEILPGGPAEASGKLAPEDKILGVAQGRNGEFEDVIDMRLRYIVRKIKGKKGTMVRLLIRPGDALDHSARKEVSIIRNEVKLTANLATAQLITVPNKEDGSIAVGVIKLPSFYGNIGAGDTLTTTSDDITELLDKLVKAGAKGIILDLRMNGGGLLSEAVRVAGLFITTGPIVQVRDKAGRIDVIPDRDPRVAWSGPLIVLTSRFSASASEIVAGALQDHGRALVVGNSSTHGKGTVQEVYHMANRQLFSFFPQKIATTRPVATKITIKQFFLPGGSSTQVKGVASDIVLPSVNEFLRIGESDLDHALAWDQIPATQLGSTWNNKINDLTNSILFDSLKQASTARQKELKEFNFLVRQINWRQERYEEKAISLHLQKRIDKKIHEQKYVEALDEEFKKFNDISYETVEFVTKISAEQETLSLKNQVTSDTTEKINPSIETAALEDKDTEDDDTPAFDIPLRESARIMADWITLSSK
ncbi:MAG: carboxy terminal-processing peptidase, partial [Verrucomicrobiota bacterium]|nr:carboxy terminal-processing peptidase [Verrucomicrobiota bacterium]